VISLTLNDGKLLWMQLKARIVCINQSGVSLLVIYSVLSFASLHFIIASG